MAQGSFRTGYEGLAGAIQSAFDTYWKRKEGQEERKMYKEEGEKGRAHTSKIEKLKRDLLKEIEDMGIKAGKYKKTPAAGRGKEEARDTYGTLKRKLMGEASDMARNIMSGNLTLQSWNSEAAAQGYGKLDEGQFQAIQDDDELLRKYLYYHLAQRYVKLYGDDEPGLEGKFYEEGFLDKYSFPELEAPPEKEPKEKGRHIGWGDVEEIEEKKAGREEKKLGKKEEREAAREEIHGTEKPLGSISFKGPKKTVDKRGNAIVEEEPEEKTGMFTQAREALGLEEKTPEEEKDEDEQIIEKLLRRLWPKKKKKKNKGGVSGSF